MQRIHSADPKVRVVELTDDELTAERRFNELLDEGYSCVEAGLIVVAERPTLDAKFIDWLVS